LNVVHPSQTNSLLYKLGYDLFATRHVIKAELLDRTQKHARDWGVNIESTFETETSVIVFGTRELIAFGSCDQQPAVLKVVKQPGDEWHSGEVLATFAGNGFVRVYEHAAGAVLLERLRPGTSLVDLALNGRDEEATSILACIIQEMSSCESSSEDEITNLRAPLQHCSTVRDWARGFDRFIASGDQQIPGYLVAAGQRVFLDLCESQRQPRLLHGDLQHYNVLFDSARGWLAIDPKGVFGEIEYEVGAALRNPVERPQLFISRSTIEQRLEQFTTILNLDYERTLRWGFAQAVLSAIWEVEDGHVLETTDPVLKLAEVMRMMLKE
jgi:streptomycin 6-kinase